jgi:hypothetical protein
MLLTIGLKQFRLRETEMETLTVVSDSCFSSDSLARLYSSMRRLVGFKNQFLLSESQPLNAIVPPPHLEIIASELVL